MKKIIESILNIIKKSGQKISIGLIIITVFGTICESISVSLIVPAVILLSKGANSFTKPLFESYTHLSGNKSYSLFVLFSLTCIVLIYLCKTFFIASVNSRQNKFVFELESKISGKLLKMYLGQPYKFHLQTNSAELTKNIYSEVKQLCNAIGQVIILFSESLIILLITIVLFYFQPLVTLYIALVIGLIAGVFITRIRKKLKIWADDRLKNDNDKVKILTGTLNNIKDVKLYGRETKFYNAYIEKSDLSIQASKMYMNFQRLPALWLEFLAILSLVALFGVMTLNSKTLLDIIPILTLFAAALFRILPSLNRISLAYQTIKFFKPVIFSVNDELNGLNPTDTITAHDENMPVFNNQIELKDVSFSYENTNNKIIDGLSLSIKKGQYIGLIGKSGYGKSTLIDIIIGLLTPTQGLVEVDGADIHKNLRHWQNQIGYVAQTINLIDDTIANNIAFGIEAGHVNHIWLKQAIIDAQLESFINALPAGAETMVGERGVRLSGGQRQRIGIARALYHNPAILVFDEATNSLDTKTEFEIMKSINLLRAKKTIIFVTHKNELLKDCDEVHELKKGTLYKDIKIIL